MLNIQESQTVDQSFDVSYKNHPINGVDYFVSEARTIEEGIENSIKNKSVNLLIVQKSKSNFWNRIFGSSVTRKLMFKVKIPIIVFH